MGSSLTFASILSLLALGGNIQLPQDTIKAKRNQVNTYNMPSITGLWQLQLDNKDSQQPNCQEQIYLSHDYQFTVQSGAEFSYGQYKFGYHNEQLPILSLKIIYDNNQIDCSGQKIDQSGEINQAYVKHDGNIMQWCNDRQGRQCPMTFYRVLP